jgi:hypothetical protein
MEFSSSKDEREQSSLLSAAQLKDESATTCPSKGWSLHGIVMEDVGTALSAVTDLMSNV